MRDAKNRIISDTWHPTKNGDMTPEDVGPGTVKYVWWQGKCGHEWYRPVFKQVNDPDCPYCSNKEALLGFNDLETKRPDLAEEWHPIKNRNLTPQNVTVIKKNIVWWKCKKCGYEWQQPICDRVKNSECPYCSPPLSRSLATLKPRVAKLWHPEKNGDLTPSLVSADSIREVWWKGKCGHEWYSAISKQNMVYPCPYCSGRKLLVGFNDFETKFPRLAKEWHPTKNEDLSPNMIMASYNKNVWWQCQHKHNWQATPQDRAEGKLNSDCPYCSNRELLVGFNDLASRYPDIAAQWHNKYNKDLSPQQTIFNATGILIWWQCEKDKNHVWQATPYQRVPNAECPYCSGKTLLKGNNDLLALYNDIAEEWHPWRNKGRDIAPETATINNDCRVWWKCKKCGHEWKKSISSRVKNPACPACTPPKPKESVDHSLAANNLALATEWHPTYNAPLTPDKINIGSLEFVWWKCTSGHEWEASVHSRNAGAKCPYCSGRYSIPGETDLATTHIEIAYEWHPDKNEDLTPLDVTANSKRKVWWMCNKGHEWQAQVINRTSSDTGCPYCNNDIISDKPNPSKSGLNKTHPGLLKEWHPTRNGSLKPKDVTANSGKQIWWLCEKGHEWQEMPYYRSRGHKCPICGDDRYANLVKKAWEIPREKSIAIINPAVAAEWHPTRNLPLSPYMLSPGSNRKVWWKCKECNYEWEAFVYVRNMGRGCPNCAGTKIRGKMSLADHNPELVSEWHPTKNGELLPENVSYGSHKKVWWKCKECNYEWEAFVYARSMGRVCPNCAGVSGLTKTRGKISLAEHNPELVSEWHPTKNGELLPENVSYGSGKKVWWKCKKCNHEWEAFVYSRYLGKGCPSCGRGKIIHDTLADANPRLALEWHPTKNGTLTPDKVSCVSNYKAWWKCEKGHEWMSIIQSRNNGKGCPYCGGSSTSYRTISLQEENPELASEWHPTKNGNLSPKDVTAGSKTKVWWICKKCGNEWRAPIFSRAGRKDEINGRTKKHSTGCPNCNKTPPRALIVGENDLATTNPDLAKEWHPTKNNGLQPHDFLSGSNKYVWWKCEKGHEWNAKIITRSFGARCPYCTGKYAIAGENDLATKYPGIAAEWHPSKNNNLTPQMVKPGSERNVWWLCSKCGHEWQEKIFHRIRYQSCPNCQKND